MNNIYVYTSWGWRQVTSLNFNSLLNQKTMKQKSKTFIFPTKYVIRKRFKGWPFSQQDAYCNLSCLAGWRVCSTTTAAEATQHISRCEGMGYAWVASLMNTEGCDEYMSFKVVYSTLKNRVRKKTTVWNPSICNSYYLLHSSNTIKQTKHEHLSLE